MKKPISIFCAFLFLFFAVFQFPPQAEAVGESQVASLVLAAMTACGISFSISGSPSDSQLISGVDSLLDSYSSAASTAIPSWSDIESGVSTSGGFLRVSGESSAMTFLHGFLSWLGLSYGGQVEPIAQSDSVSYVMGLPQDSEIDPTGSYSSSVNGRTVRYVFSNYDSYYVQMSVYVNGTNIATIHWNNRSLNSRPTGLFIGPYASGAMSYCYQGGNRLNSEYYLYWYQTIANACGISYSDIGQYTDTSYGSSISASVPSSVTAPDVSSTDDWLISAPAGTQFGEGLLDGSLSDALTGIRSDVLDGTATADQTVAGTATATESISVSEGQSSITSLWNWALVYISPDDGLFSKFPFCVPYDMYYFFSRLNSGSSSSMLNWSKSGLSSISSGSSPSTSSYSVNVGSNISVSGISLPLSGTLNLTPYLSYLHFIRVMLSIIFIAIFIASFRKGGDD